ncbi:Histidinol-phosphate/aromatic aminotransferase and cobyric acid decarboxylase [[Clostridium] cf. saccharolyticum K10]|uniref:pyridoxal phosphate-dependent aminotransferase n=1 Tax=Clostridium sp. AM29-11AC TaxID=2293028 RepID=UPI0001CCD902|nr:threonine-phosphate decarboxylase [Clostridium sp. AM29-11AC]CBK77809.1 Histidinol-phosphate/aromatic aminotransferase and cobyric acid decarboxylase [[Clostridium] cf. saccharolyticum K10]
MSQMVWPHGGDIYGSDKIRLDFSVNTSPLGTPQAVIDAVASCREEILRYPDSQCRKLKAALSDVWKIPSSRLICTNGAADLIFGLAEAVRPRRAVLFSPCFSEYESALSLKGCEISYARLEAGENWLPDASVLEEILSKQKGTDLVFLGNPNNPTGMALPAEKMENFVKICARYNALLAVDECFNGFLEKPEEFTMAGMLERYGNLLILNAFTKTYGMAGVRLGYGMSGNRELLLRIEAVRPPWSVSGIAQKAGIAALTQPDFPKQAAELVRREREFLKNGLSKLGFRVWPSMVNYLLFSVFPDENERGFGTELGDFLLKQGILIRSCANFRGLDRSFYRICVKTRKENEELLQYIARWAESEKCEWQRRL